MNRSLSMRSVGVLCLFAAALTTGPESRARAQNIPGRLVAPSAAFIQANESVNFAGWVELTRSDNPVVLAIKDMSTGEWVKTAEFPVDGISEAVVGGAVTKRWSGEQAFGFEEDKFVREVKTYDTTQDLHANVINIAFFSEGEKLKTPVGDEFLIHVYCGEPDQECCKQLWCNNGGTCNGDYRCEAKPEPEPTPDPAPKPAGEWWAVSCLCSDSAGMLKDFGLEYCFDGAPKANAVCTVEIDLWVQQLTGDPNIQCVGTAVSAVGDGQRCNPAAGAARNRHVGP